MFSVCVRVCVRVCTCVRACVCVGLAKVSVTQVRIHFRAKENQNGRRWMRRTMEEEGSVGLHLSE